ncbi:hypothetical protein FVEN_g11431 [Fusarium venenatum]|uniref:Uncharacterized protein n=1 Tax=Fusarium venenatum TaxID=56646 RepID=A0A2L2TVC4_9HYPO|nr:uncharacterized protein FVRRES_09814 [Fusarium venenatum]KAG8350410.1 hypothetical protein FVEN_g11431 [Fusarium venenatum]KAH6966466.1 hypothetical protein EDB82DRAFT_332965 [Fusarium venenatum]CEI69737.1 unnamed protein product [Fusarium venenatum]
MAALLSGAVYGASTIAGGAYLPSTIIDQFKFQDWHLLQTTLGAVASSAIIYRIAEHFGYVKLKPRSSSPIGLFGKYDGNVIGGFLLGAGMALSGSCPGTLFAQIGAGLRTGFHALGGALVGGIAYTGYVAQTAKAQREKADVKPETVTLDENLGLSKDTTTAVFESACFNAIAASVTYTTGSDWSLFSAGGGLFIGLSQLFSILTRRSMLGISGSYEEFGNHFWWLTRGTSWPSSRQNTLFAAGMASGAWVLTKIFPSFVPSDIVEVNPWFAGIGGFMMVVGSRLAGGCTSGHGISGLSLMSTSSLVTMGTAFAAGSLVAPLAH